MAGIAVFTIASLVNGVATSSGVLIGGRAVQGLGAALVSPAALSIVTTTFAEGRERTKALGIWSAIAAGGGAVGLILGGLLTDTLSWRWVFFINLPIGIIAFAALAPVHREHAVPRSSPETVDVAGATTVTAGLLVLVYDIVKAQQYGWASGRARSALFAVAAALLASLRRDRAALEGAADPARDLPDPLAHDRERRDAVRRLRAVRMFYFASIYVQEILGYRPLKAGFAFRPGHLRDRDRRRPRAAADPASRDPRRRCVGNRPRGDRADPAQPDPDPRLVSGRRSLAASPSCRSGWGSPSCR